MNDVSQLVFSIQQGRDDLIPLLWEAVRGLVVWSAKRFMLLNREWTEQRGYELEDLTQCGYFALLQCLKAYDPEKGAFSSLFVHYLRSEFQTALGRSPRLRGDMLNHCISLDAVLDSEDDSTLYDLIPDGTDYCAAIEHKVYLQQLHEELEKVLASIPASHAEIIRATYYEGKTLTELAAAEEQTIENIRRKKETGLRELRRSKYIRDLEKFLDERTDFFNGSSAEKIAVHRENLAQHYNRQKSTLYKETIQ